MKRSFVLARCIALLLSLCTALYSIHSSALDCPKKPWQAALYDNGMLGLDGKTGIDKELLDEIAKRTGCKFADSVQPRARIWYQLENGGLDLSVTAIETPERRRFAWFIHYLKMKNWAVLHPKVPALVESSKDFLEQPSLFFGAIRSYKHGVFHDQFLELLKKQNRVLYYPDIHTLYKALKQNRVQAIFAQPPVYFRMSANTGLDKDFRLLDWAPTEADTHHGVVLSKQSFSQKQQQEWQELFDEMRQDGTLERIFHNHLPYDLALGLLLDQK